MKRIKKQDLTKNINSCFCEKPTNKTITLEQLINLTDYLINEKRNEQVLKAWLHNHILKNDFCEWEQKQINNAPSNNKKKLTSLFFEQINNITNITFKCDILINYIYQNKKTKEISINYEKVNNIF